MALKYVLFFAQFVDGHYNKSVWQRKKIVSKHFQYIEMTNYSLLV